MEDQLEDNKIRTHRDIMDLVKLDATLHRFQSVLVSVETSKAALQDDNVQGCTMAMS